MPYIMIGILVIILPIASLYFFKHGIKKGMNDFLALLIKSGYAAKVKSFETQNKLVKKGGIVFVGDSITQDFNVYEYFPDYLVYNRGIGGDTTKGLLDRLESSIFELEPQTVVLLMGTNDFAVLNDDVQRIFDRMKMIVDTILKRLPETKILLQSVYPVNGELDPMSVGIRHNKDIQTLNLLYQSIEGVTYIDLFQVLLDENGRLNPIYTVEGLHINDEGYLMIKTMIEPYLA